MEFPDWLPVARIFVLLFLGKPRFRWWISDNLSLQSHYYGELLEITFAITTQG